MAAEQIEMAHCNRCHGETRHTLIAVRDLERSLTREDGWEIEWGRRYSMLQCCGCEDVVMRVDYWHSEVDIDEPDFFPPRISRPMPRWVRDLPADYQELLREVYTALHADSLRLAMMGARTLVDLYMNEAIGDIGGFEKKLKALSETGHLAELDRETLESALNAGHAAAHRAHRPTHKQANYVMDIVENLLQKHALKIAAAKLNESIPARQRQPRS